MSSTTPRMALLAVASSFFVLAPLASGSHAETSAMLDLAPLAYIGPGAGLGAIGALLAVLGAIVLCAAGLALYPLQLLRNRLRGRQKASADGSSKAAPSA